MLYVGVDADGVIDLDELAERLDERCAVVSVMTANNETGVCQPVDAVSSIAAARAPGGVPLHTDAVAAAPWLHLPTVTATASLVSVCAHKIGGPVNSGALVVREGVALDPVTPGGGQERGRRGGTVDVAAAVGLAAAARATARDLTARPRARRRSSQRAWPAALALVPGARLTAAEALRLPGTVHLTFEGVASDELMFLVDQEGALRVGGGQLLVRRARRRATCSPRWGSSPSARAARCACRWAPETTEADVDAAVAIVAAAVHRLRADG